MDATPGARAGDRDDGSGTRRMANSTAAGAADAGPRIAALQLDVVRRLAVRTYPEWTGEDADRAEREYRDFLYVCWYSWRHASTTQLAAMCRRADQMWHCHMLLPHRYGADCEGVFGAGHILDHDPFFAEGDWPPRRKQAADAYRAAGRDFPSDDLIANCQYSIVA